MIKTWIVHLKLNTVNYNITMLLKLNNNGLTDK
jgi:hypothetical protein